MTEIRPSEIWPAEIWPQELRITPQGENLSIAFTGGENFTISAELLRVESPSAEVKGHGLGQEMLVSGKSHIQIINAEPVGNYAVRLIFSDGHNTGLYTWPYLYELGQHQSAYMDAYCAKLAKAGLSRQGGA